MRTRGTRTRMQAVVALLVAAVCVAGGSAAWAAPDDAPTPRVKGKFRPHRLSGTWTGQWATASPQASGPIRLTVTANKNQFGMAFDADGNVFGCGDPPAEPAVPIRRGKGPNTWNRKGFNVELANSPTFGSMRAVYTFRNDTLTGNGGAPACAPQIVFELNGILTYNQLDAEVDVHLGDGQTVVVNIVVNKLPGT